MQPESELQEKNHASPPDTDMQEKVGVSPRPVPIRLAFLSSCSLPRTYLLIDSYIKTDVVDVLLSNKAAPFCPCFRDSNNAFMSWALSRHELIKEMPCFILRLLHLFHC